MAYIVHIWVTIRVDIGTAVHKTALLAVVVLENLGHFSKIPRQVYINKQIPFAFSLSRV
jgi:hypothetical protein